MKKAIFALTTALALASPSLTLEARAGNPFVEYQQKMSQKETASKSKNSNSFTDYQEKISQKSPDNSAKYESKKQENPVVVYKTENPVQVQGTLIDLTKRTSDKYIKYANLEQITEEIPAPVPQHMIPQPPVAQEYPAAQYASQSQYVQAEQPGVCKRVQPMPEVCKPVQKIPMLVQGPPVVQVVPQTVYAPTVVIPSPTIVQPVVPVVPVRPVHVHSCGPGYVVYRNCIARPFGGLFRGIGIAARWLVAGPRHVHNYFPATPYANPYYPAPMFNAPVMGHMPGRPVPMGPMTHVPYRPFW